MSATASYCSNCGYPASKKLIRKGGIETQSTKNKDSSYTLLIITGIVFLFLGIFASAYSITTSQSHLWGLYSTSTTSTPYYEYSIPLLIGGIILIIIPAVMKGGKK